MTSVEQRTSLGQLPNFLVIGAMKAGTSSLYQYLRVHPEVFMPTSKELSFFAYEHDRRRDLDWYRKQFSGAGTGVVAYGEASTMYTKYPRHSGVPERIAQVLPDVKLVYVIRDPVERLRSHYQHQKSVGAEHAPIEEAVRRDPGYLDCSRYAMQIERYLAIFPREQLHIITAEALRHDRRSTMTSVYSFLGVDPSFVPSNIDREFFRTDERVPYPPLAWRMRRALKRRFPTTRRIRLTMIPGVRTLGRARHRVESSASSGEFSLVTDALRSQLVDELKEDVRRLHAYMPSDFDGWGIG